MKFWAIFAIMGMLKKVLFQIHWFVGITAGSLLMMVGVTGAILAFSEEIIDALNPGVIEVTRQSTPALDVPQLVARIQAANPDKPILAIAVMRDPDSSADVHSVRVNFAPPPGERRGDLRYADPYTGNMLPALRAEPFFKWIEFLHRFLLLPTPTGRIVMGSAAMCLLFLALSGLYMRWPRQALQWRAWFRLDFSLQGRSFLWHIHSMIGTWALVIYVISATTGMYWAFEWFKQGVNEIAGQAEPKLAGPRKAAGDQSAARATRLTKPKPGAREPLQDAQMTRIWDSFNATVPMYNRVLLRFQERASDPVQVSYLLPDAPHDQALNRMRIDPETGAVSNQTRFNDKDAAGRLLSAVYPLHMGTYFGLPGRIIMTFGALCLPLFGVTGWMLYLDRRRKKRAVATARRAMDAVNGAASDVGTGADAGTGSTTSREKILVVFASQSGYAERIALQTAGALKSAGLTVDLRSAGQTGLEQLRHYQQVLFVVSTFGDGEAPDSARAFTRQLMHQPASLPHLHYAVLALGDRHYQHFCGYGHTLDFHLQSQGAQSRFAMIEVSNGDPVALASWQRALADCYGVTDVQLADAAGASVPAAAPYRPWQLLERKQLNPGSQGEPLFHLTLRPQSDAHWQSGALVEILPRHAPLQVDYFLQQTGLDGNAMVTFNGGQCMLGEVLSRSVLPTPAAQLQPQSPVASHSPQDLADTLKPLASRRYSVSSIVEDNSLQLLVRQSTHEGGLGLASGWLTAHLQLGGTVEGRLLENPSFALSEADVPAIFIGNGSGMAGLRSHLRARVRTGQRQNWLLFGERNRAHDGIYADELALLQKDGFLPRLDLAFSRDQPERIYVQDKLREAGSALREWLAVGAVIYVCGSMEGMAAGVDAVLMELIGEEGLEALIAANRYRRDIY
jgi:sulfite reductase (NADPH) flavoprotein alpha-component